MLRQNGSYTALKGSQAGVLNLHHLDYIGHNGTYSNTKGTISYKKVKVPESVKEGSAYRNPEIIRRPGWENNIKKYSTGCKSILGENHVINKSLAMSEEPGNIMYGEYKSYGDLSSFEERTNTGGNGNKPEKKPLNIKLIVILSIIALIIIAAVCFINFVPFGYRLTLGIHGFDEQGENIYIDRDYMDDFNTANALVETAKSLRVSAFFGEEINGSIKIVITNDEKKLKKLGGECDVFHSDFPGERAYAVFSAQNLNIDTISEVLTVAELYMRFKNAEKDVPAWFMYGIGMLNNYSPDYGEEAYEKVTAGGTEVISLDSIASKKSFFDGSDSQISYRKTISRHEVNSWFEDNGIEGLKKLIENINSNQSFENCFR